MSHSKLALALYLLTFSSLLQAKESILSPINPGKDTFVRLPGTDKKVARVRVGVELVPYKKILVTQKDGKQKYSFAKSSAIKRNLKSRIDRITHFYIDRWHFELKPLTWDKNSMNLKYQARLFKQYGTRKELEEQVGSIEVSGVISGKRYLYNFDGQTRVKFTNKLGQPIIDVMIGAPHVRTKTMNIARASDESPAAASK